LSFYTPEHIFYFYPFIYSKKNITLLMRRIFTIALTAALPALPTIASAHAGHSEFPADHILHYLATPAHAMPLLMAAVLIVVTDSGHPQGVGRPQNQKQERLIGETGF
jgi:hypothetical protein